MELKKGETIMIDAALHLPASFLHEAFSDRSGVPLALFELYYRGKRLEGEAALASLGVEKGSTIEVKMRGRGGGNTERKRPQKPDEGSSSLSNLHPEQVPLGTEPSSPKTPSQGNAEKKLLQNTKDASEEQDERAAVKWLQKAEAEVVEMEGEHKEEVSAANLDPLDNIPVDPSNTETVKDTVAPSPPAVARFGAEVRSAPAASSLAAGDSGVEEQAASQARAAYTHDSHPT